MRKSSTKALIALHLILVMFSFSGVCSKMAAGGDFLSFRFLLFYGLEIVLLGLYAIGWQQVIKHLPLTVAYANRALTTGWSLLWGVLFFSESVTPGKLIGIALIIVGVVLFSTSEKEKSHE